MELSAFFTCFLVFCVFSEYTLAAPGKRRKRSNLKCDHRSLAVYNLTFHGNWSPTNYPRMYPTSRPHAQWSKLIGRTHDDTYNMWTSGHTANSAMKLFAEAGDSTIYDKEAQGYNGVFDMFSGAPLQTGVGSTSTKVIADGYHHMISFLVKIVPSPDWFVGEAGVNLCSKGRWRRKVIVKLRPLDAGTDRGLTYTSPKWPIVPAENIYELSPKKPNHPASAFNYKNSNRLPKIATVTMFRIADLKLKNGQIYDERGVPNVIASPLYPGASTNSPSTHTKLDSTEPGMENGDDSSKTGSFRLLDSIPSTSMIGDLKLQRTNTDTPTPRQDCVTGDWSQFTPCSKTCGFGRRERRREVLKAAVSGGIQCPNLIDSKVCGSMRTCQWKHFGNFFSGSRSGRKTRTGR